ncbi:phosphopantetheine-binding protein [Kitasatospora sp. NPDC094019]|uniref:phosphopantetheine-binding protein n=1 Tax=Kitasatospora sp. NPDC094019 TaxID=3364091 RepID=UPI0038258243
MADVNSRLAALWTELLGCEEVTEETDFFESGGTSVVAVHLAAEIQDRLLIEVDAIEIVTHRTFGELAALLGGRIPADVARE